MAILYTNNSSGYFKKNRKKAKNLSVNQLSKYEVDLRKHNKHMKKLGLHDMMFDLETYVKYRHGLLKTKIKSREFVPLTSVEPYKRETPNYPSLSDNFGNGGTIDHKQRQERIEISKQFSVVPAYNKGPYMVVGKEDLKTAGRKV